MHPAGSVKRSYAEESPRLAPNRTSQCSLQGTARLGTSRIPVLNVRPPDAPGVLAFRLPSVREDRAPRKILKRNGVWQGRSSFAYKALLYSGLYIKLAHGFLKLAVKPQTCEKIANDSRHLFVYPATVRNTRCVPAPVDTLHA